MELTEEVRSENNIGTEASFKSPGLLRDALDWLTWNKNKNTNTQTVGPREPMHKNFLIN